MRILFLFISIFLFSCHESEWTNRDASPEGDSLDFIFPSKENSTWVRKGYYPSGELFVEHHRKNIDKDVLWNSIWYYRDGSLFKYKCYLNGNLRYFRDYSKENKVEKTKGNPFLWCDSINTIFTDATGSYTRKIYSVTPPNCVDTLMICDWVLDTAIQESNYENCYLYLVDNGYTSYRFMNDSNEYRKKIIYYLIQDTLSGYLEKGSFIDNWVVKKK
ncbi:hypothetical protein BH09BAC5_BH09BAC5_05380 [soil metagenome]